MLGETARGALRGLVALLVTIGSALLGRAYVAYLRATPFPPESAQAMPFTWLLGALLGLVLALRTLRRGPRDRRGVLGLALGIIGALLALPNIAQAALYAFAAMMGD